MPEFGNPRQMFDEIARLSEKLGITPKGSAASNAAHMKARMVVAKAQHTSRKSGPAAK